MVFPRELDETNPSRNQGAINGSERMSLAEPSFRESVVAPVSSPYLFNVQKGAISVKGKTTLN